MMMMMMVYMAIFYVDPKCA